MLSFCFLRAMRPLRGLVSRQSLLVMSQRCDLCDARLSPTIDAAFWSASMAAPSCEQREAAAEWRLDDA